VSENYKPGDTVYFTASMTSLGAAISPSSVVLTVDAPNGTQYTPSVSMDSTGEYHATLALPSSAPVGVWWARWTATSPNGLVERSFGVIPLAF